MENKNNHTVGVQVLVTKNSQILLGYHLDKKVYGVPGGHWERGESLEEAAIREVKEESGITCTNLKFVTNYEHYNKEKDRNYLTVSYYADYSTGNFLNEENKTSNWMWIEPEKALEFDLYTTGRRLIENYVSIKR